MNKYNLALAFSVRIRSEISIILLASLFCFQPAMRAQPTKPADLAEVPSNLSLLVERFIETINSNEIWNLGPLMRPDLSRDEAVSGYLKNNPDLAAEKLLGNAPAPRKGENSYILWEYFKPNNQMWIAVYALKGQSKENAPLSTLWAKSGDTWKLVGSGWPLSLSIEQAKKNFGETSR